MTDLERRFGVPLVRGTLEALSGLGALEDASGDDGVPAGERERWDRQLRYFSDVGGPDRTPSERQDRLREAKVAVLGVGGLGTWSPWALA